MRARIHAGFGVAILVAVSLIAQESSADAHQETYRLSEAVPVTDREVEVAVELKNDLPTGDSLLLEIVDPDGRAQRIGGQPSEHQGQWRGKWTPSITGFHELRVIDPGGNARVIPPKIPVLSRPLQLVYWSAPEATRAVTWRLCREEEANGWKQRGVIAGRWAPGICNPSWSASDFIQQWSQPLSDAFGALLIDEFRGVGGRPLDEELAKALAALPPSDLRIGVWTIGLKAGTAEAEAFKRRADLVMLECYVDHAGFDAHFEERWNAAREADITDKSIFALWLGRVIANPDELDRQLRLIRTVAPESTGVCLNGDATSAMYREADRLVTKWFIQPVLTLEEDKGHWWCRNIGWMGARNVKIGSEKQPHQIAAELPVINPGERVAVPRSVQGRPVIIDGDSYQWRDKPVVMHRASNGTESFSSEGISLSPDDEEIIEGDLQRLPLGDLLGDNGFEMKFTLDIITAEPYGILRLGLGQGQQAEYPWDFMERFPKESVKRPRMEFKFYRGDIEMKAGDSFKGMRLFFGFQNDRGEFLRIVPETSFETGKSYEISLNVSGEKVALRVIGDDGISWYSGAQTFPVQSGTPFDEGYISVRAGGGSALSHIPAEEAFLLESSGATESLRIAARAKISGWRIFPSKEPTPVK